MDIRSLFRHFFRNHSHTVLDYFETMSLVFWCPFLLLLFGIFFLKNVGFFSLGWSRSGF